MLSNTSSGGEGSVETSKSSGVRKLVKRNNKQNESQKPKISRLGMKAKSEVDSGVAKRGVRRLGAGDKTPESSNVSVASTAGGSDSERSDKSAGKKFETNVGDEWNKKSASVDDAWDDKSTEWDDLGLEPVCVKKKMYKCGPVSDEEEPQTFPRLQAAAGPSKVESRRFKNPEMNYLKQEVTEMYQEPVKHQKQEIERPKPSFLNEERDQNFQQRAPLVQQTSWLRGSWLANVSKSVASLTAQVSQNISSALDTDTTPQTDDLRQLVAERLKDHRESDQIEESPRKGRKYLHKIGIEDDIRPVYAFQEKTEVPSNARETYDNNKMNENRTTSHPSHVDTESKPVSSVATPQFEDSWNQNWENDFNVAPVKKSQSKVQSTRVQKQKKLDKKGMTHAFLQGEVMQQEVIVQKKDVKMVETVPKETLKEKIESRTTLIDQPEQKDFSQSDSKPTQQSSVIEKNLKLSKETPKQLKNTSSNDIMTIECTDEVTIVQKSTRATHAMAACEQEVPSETVQETVTDSWDAWKDEDEPEIPQTAQELTVQDVCNEKNESKLSENVFETSKSTIGDPRDALNQDDKLPLEPKLSQTTVTESSDVQNLNEQLIPVVETISNEIPITEVPKIPAQIEVEPEIVKKDMYKCGNEPEEAPKPFDQPLKIAVNEENQEWNDWDQEMIVDVAVTEESILTLETPVTEMHLSSTVKSSALHSPPFTINNERVRGARGSICEFDEYMPSLGNLTKQEMEERIKASLSVEMNKFYEQSSDNEWNESESEMVFEEDSYGSTKGVGQELCNIQEGIATNNWLVEEKIDSVQVKSLLNETDVPKDVPIPNAEKPAKIEVEPDFTKKFMYKCGSEGEEKLPGEIEPHLLLSATTHVEMAPIQEIVEETVEYSTVKSQCFSVPVPTVIPEVAKKLEKDQNDPNTSKPAEELPSIPEKSLHDDESKGLTHLLQNETPLDIDSQIKIEVEPEIIKKDMYKCGSEEKLDEVSDSSKEIPILPSLLAPKDAEWTESDWGSNISDPGSSSLIESESEDELVLDTSHPDVRQSTKQKTVEECISLLKQNREELSKKLEEKKKENEIVTEEMIEEPMIVGQTIAKVESSLHKPKDTPHRSQFSPEPETHAQTSHVSWEDDELNFEFNPPQSIPDVQTSAETNTGHENRSEMTLEPPGEKESTKEEVGWGDDWSEDPLEDENHVVQENPPKEAQIEVEPIITRRDMYKCGSADELEDPIETFESRRVEGSENKRPEPIGASFDQDVVSATAAPGDWDDWNEPEKVVHNEPWTPQNQEVESADPDDDWNDNWGEENDIKAESTAIKADSGEKEVNDVSMEAETSNDNDWDDFDAWGEEDGVQESEVQVQQKEEVQSSSGFKIPEPPTRYDSNIPDEKPIENVFSKLENKNQWNWKTNWGVSLLANASKNVASITAQVSQNLSSALDTGIILQPEEMAKIVKKDEKTARERTVSESSQRSKEGSIEPESDRSRKSSVESCESETGKRRFIPLTNLVTGVTQISSKVITGGLDTLEGIGKKTFTMIQENVDTDRKGLSDILNEAKLENTPDEVKPKEKLPQFEIMFDDYQGLVHLEALEILSKQATIKIDMILSQLSGDELTKMQKTLDLVEELSSVLDTSEIDEGDGTGVQLEDRLLFAVRDLDVELTFSEILDACMRINKYLTRNGTKADAKELYEKGLDALAEFTALAVARFHKLAELLSVAKYHSTANEVDALVSLTKAFYWQINNIATRFNKLLNALEKSDNTNLFITNIFLEASHANSYIEQAFNQFTPILKIGAT